MSVRHPSRHAVRAQALPSVRSGNAGDGKVAGTGLERHLRCSLLQGVSFRRRCRRQPGCEAAHAVCRPIDLIDEGKPPALRGATHENHGRGYGVAGSHGVRIWSVRNMPDDGIDQVLLPDTLHQKSELDVIGELHEVTPSGNMQRTAGPPPHCGQLFVEVGRIVLEIGGRCGSEIVTVLMYSPSLVHGSVTMLGNWFNGSSTEKEALRARRLCPRNLFLGVFVSQKCSPKNKI